MQLDAAIVTDAGLLQTKVPVKKWFAVEGELEQVWSVKYGAIGRQKLSL